jgi:hypothetical protein
MEIEVRPGLVSKDSEGKLTCRPIFSRIVSLFAEQNELQFAVPGGLIGKQRLHSVKAKYDLSRFTRTSYVDKRSKRRCDVATMPRKGRI